MTATKVQAKLQAMAADEACKWILDHYTGTGNIIVVRFDGAEAASPVTVNCEPTPYTVATFKHIPINAIRMLSNDHDVNIVYMVGRYWEQGYHNGHWRTSVYKYVRRQRGYRFAR